MERHSIHSYFISHVNLQCGNSGLSYCFSYKTHALILELNYMNGSILEFFFYKGEILEILELFSSNDVPTKRFDPRWHSIA